MEWAHEMIPKIKIYPLEHYKEALLAVANREILGKAVIPWNQNAKL